MWKKIREGKIMSPPSKTKRRSKRVQTKFCKTCGQDILENERRDMYRFQDTYHQLNVKDYCKDHEAVYSNHKCKPHWCGDCGYLRNYEIEIDQSDWRDK